MRPRLYVGVALLVGAVAVLSAAAVTSTEVKRIQEASAALREIHQAPDKDIPQDLWEKASCVAVIPSLKKAAFIVGGEYGKGIMSCRNGKGWSAPSFMRLEKGSVGFQIGGESVDLVMLVMDEHGVDQLLQDKVTLGGEVSIAAGPVGRDARALTNGQIAQILSYSRSEGLFAGVDLTGGVLKPDRDDNRDLYGAAITARDILVARRVGIPPAAKPFIAALNRTVPREVANK